MMVNVLISLHVLTIFAKTLARFLPYLAARMPYVHLLPTELSVSVLLDGLETLILSATLVCEYLEA